jgi:hypothetical protein
MSFPLPRRHYSVDKQAREIDIEKAVQRPETAAALPGMANRRNPA